MKKDLELLKNSKVAYIVANVKWFDKEDSYTLVETAFEDKYIQLKREIDEEYKRKLTELEETKRKEYLQTVEVEKNAKLRLYAEACDRKLDHEDRLNKFRKDHQICDEQMMQLLEQETGKQWKIVKNSYIGSSGYDGNSRACYFGLIIHVYLVNSDYYNFNGRLSGDIYSQAVGVNPMLYSVSNHVLFHKNMEEAKKRKVESYGVDWLAIYLQYKGLLEEENPELIANSEIKNLIIRAIDNYIFSENDEEKSQD